MNNSPSHSLPGQALAHAVIWIGIAITALPLYIAFVASTLSNPDIAQAPMPLWPGDQGWENYRQGDHRGHAGRAFVAAGLAHAV